MHTNYFDCHIHCRLVRLLTGVVPTKSINCDEAVSLGAAVMAGISIRIFIVFVCVLYIAYYCLAPVHTKLCIHILRYIMHIMHILYYDRYIGRRGDRYASSVSLASRCIPHLTRGERENRG